MRESEEQDFREGLIYDAAVKGFDSNFWKGDTANLLEDTVKGVIKIGDTALPGSVSSYSQYLYGDFEFGMLIDSTHPDTGTDCELFFGLRNLGDTLNRGAAYFDLSYDTTAGDSSPDTASFAAVIWDEEGNRQRKFLTWDSNTMGSQGRLARFRIKWESTGYTFLVNDSVIATLGDRVGVGGTVAQINTSIPQALRLSKRSNDTTDTSSTSFKYINIRHARKII